MIFVTTIQSEKGRIQEMDDEFEKLTVQLGLPDLSVISKLESNYNTLLIETVPSHKMCMCPFCGSRQIKQLNRFSRNFWDVAYIDDGKIVQIHHSFHRYKCKNEQCGHVFSDPLSFARPRAQVTYRFERFVFNYILTNDSSFSDVALLTDNALSRQAIRKIFYRYLKENVAKDPSFL